MPNKFRPVGTDELVAVGLPLLLNFPNIYSGTVQSILLMSSVKVYKHRQIRKFVETFTLYPKTVYKMTHRHDTSTTPFWSQSAEHCPIINLSESFRRVQDFPMAFMNSNYFPDNMGNYHRAHTYGVSSSYGLTVKSDGCAYYNRSGYGVHVSYYRYSSEYKTKRGKLGLRKSQYIVENFYGHQNGYVLRPFDHYYDTMVAHKGLVQDLSIDKAKYCISIDSDSLLAVDSPIAVLGASWFYDRYVDCKPTIISAGQSGEIRYYYIPKAANKYYLFFSPLIEKKIHLTYYKSEETND